VTPPEAARVVHSRRKPPRAPRLLLALLLLLLGAALFGYYLLRPRLRFTNLLAAPVQLTVDTDAARLLGSSESVRIPVSSGKTILVSWDLVQPLSADRKPMGEAVRGSLTVRERWGTIQRSASARGTAGDYFAPLITNASQDLLRVRVNAGLEGAVDCGCAVRPGARRVFIGYYRLYQNSTVLAAARGRRNAIFRDLGGKVAAADGTVGLRFEDKDLRVR
jgi:hypothetical protein